MTTRATAITQTDRRSAPRRARATTPPRGNAESLGLNTMSPRSRSHQGLSVEYKTDRAIYVLDPRDVDSNLARTAAARAKAPAAKGSSPHACARIQRRRLLCRIPGPQDLRRCDPQWANARLRMGSTPLPYTKARMFLDAIMSLGTTASCTSTRTDCRGSVEHPRVYLRRAAGFDQDLGAESRRLYPSEVIRARSRVRWNGAEPSRHQRQLLFRVQRFHRKPPAGLAGLLPQLVRRLARRDIAGERRAGPRRVRLGNRHRQKLRMGHLDVQHPGRHDLLEPDGTQRVVRQHRARLHHDLQDAHGDLDLPHGC